MQVGLGGLHMLGAIGFDASSITNMIPGLLSTAGGALSGPSKPTPEQQKAQAELQKKQADAAKAAKTKKIAWIAGGLAALGVVAVLFRNVIRKVLS